MAVVVVFSHFRLLFCPIIIRAVNRVNTLTVLFAPFPRACSSLKCW